MSVLASARIEVWPLTQPLLLNLWRRNNRASNIAVTNVQERVIVMFRNSAIRSDNGGCVLKSPANNCPADSGCTIINAEVDAGTFIGIFLL